MSSATGAGRTGRLSQAALDHVRQAVVILPVGAKQSRRLMAAGGVAGDKNSIAPNALSRFVPMRMKRRGVEMRLIIDGDAASLARIDYRCSTRPPVRIDGPTICWRVGRGRSAR